MIELANESSLNARIVVVGVGGGGGNALSTMIRGELSGVDFIAANTDSQALSQSLAATKIQLGCAMTKGLGAGANPEVFDYRGPLDCLVKLLRAEGPSALFAGLVGRFMYTGPAFALFLPTYDLLKELYASSSGG